MMRKLLIACVLLSACDEGPSDPSEGGFIAGISGIASGSYQADVDAQQAEVDAAKARNARLEAQIQNSESDLAQLKRQIRSQRATLPQTDVATSQRINRVLGSGASGSTADARLASLQKAIADAKALSSDLAQLSSG